MANQKWDLVLDTVILENLASNSASPLYEMENWIAGLIIDFHRNCTGVVVYGVFCY
jgi:hypothetical protein